MALNHYPQEEHRHRFLARQYCCSKQEVLCSEVASDAGRCMLMVGRSGDLRRIIQPHWEALYMFVWPTRQRPNDPVCTETEGGRQAGVGRHGAGWPLLAASALTLVRSVRVSRRSKRHLDARCMQRTPAIRRSRTRDGEGREGTAEGRGCAGFLRLLIRCISDE